MNGPLESFENSTKSGDPKPGKTGFPDSGKSQIRKPTLDTSSKLDLDLLTSNLCQDVMAFVIRGNSPWVFYSFCLLAEQSLEIPIWMIPSHSFKIFLFFEICKATIAVFSIIFFIANFID